MENKTIMQKFWQRWHRMVIRFVAAFSVMGALVTVGCGGGSMAASAGSNSSSGQTVANVKITPANITVAQWTQQQFSAQAFDSKGNALTGITFSWTVKGSGNGGTDPALNNATNDTVSSSGLVDVLTGGTATVSVVTTNAKFSVGGETNFTATVDPLATITLSAPTSVVAGESYSITAAIRDQTGADVTNDAGVQFLCTWSDPQANGGPLTFPCNDPQTQLTVTYSGVNNNTMTIATSLATQGSSVSVYASYGNSLTGNQQQTVVSNTVNTNLQ